MHALLQGTEVPTQFIGSLVSVHPGISPVANVALQDDDGPFLFSLITDRQHMTAGSLLLSTTAAPMLNRLAPGVVVVGSNTSIRIGSLDIILPTGQQWSGTLPRGAWSADALPSLKLLDALYGYLREHSSLQRGLAPLLIDPLPSDPVITRANAILKATALHKIPAGIVGLGPGFTPAGDDFLMGVLAEETLTGGHPERFRSSLIHRLTGTTAGGATILRHALSGSFPLYFHHICDILMYSETDLSAIAAAAWHQASNHGHSSGLDALSGFLWALRRIIP